MKKMHEKMGLNIEYPSIYAMLCWMTDANEQKGGEGMNFEEFVQQGAFFFSQRHHEHGLKSLFKLFDLDDTGELDFEEF